MSQNYSELAKDLKAQFLPEGEVELCSSSDKRYDRFTKLGLDMENSSTLLLETFERSFVVSRINENLIIAVSVHRGTHNVGVMKNITSKMKAEILSKIM